jgi:hypothetical protein
MLNFRYHALSLVAVFLSLVIGLLLGVAIGDKGLVSSGARRRGSATTRAPSCRSASSSRPMPIRRSWAAGSRAGGSP